MSGFKGRNLEHLISLMNPVYWTTAQEVGEAVNGYTLTQGNFRREVQVEFATGTVVCGSSSSSSSSSSSREYQYY